MRILLAGQATAALMLLSACGSMQASTTTTMDDFTARAREVAERWQASKEDRAWREGFVPLQNLALEPDWQRMPDWVPVSELNSVWKLEADLPSQQPAPAILSWEDGSTLTVPVVPATAAFARLSKPNDFVDEKCPAKGCRPLRVIGAVMGEATVTTSRGQVRVPTWEFTVKGVREPFRRVAVDPSAMSVPPKVRQGELQEVFTYETPTPYELEMRYGHGTCDTTRGARAYETPHVVVVDVDVRDNVRVCNAMMRVDRISVKLGGALGDRLVLDSSSGLPLLRGTDVQLAQTYSHWDPRQS
ncbi:hypothetical protein N5079_26430 [Planotetraspora sp. A-T 1434]|uniref:hypothetical protein n=1 Tax=Planotetraspora sp. A-T 1434 TaxID=2979219 RepID=UPI0021C09934|nr:hypothetical protein [Planotetraspora sp. A-T 1434]MCT9933755.1 hypothetical protein [Planotetraspora sp. A-T 1434]